MRSNLTNVILLHSNEKHAPQAHHKKSAKMHDPYILADFLFQSTVLLSTKGIHMLLQQLGAADTIITIDLHKENPF